MATSTLTSAQKSALDYISDYLGVQDKAAQLGDIVQQVESTVVSEIDNIPTSGAGSTVVSNATSFNTTRSSVVSSYSTINKASSVAASSTVSSYSTVTSSALVTVSSVTSSYSTIRTAQSVTTSQGVSSTLSWSTITSSELVTTSSHMSLTHAAGSVMGSRLQAGDAASAAGSKAFQSFAVEGEVWGQIGSAISSASV